MRKIILLPNKKLREISVEVQLPLSDEDIKLAEEMIDYIDTSGLPNSGVRPGIGVAAVQLGELKRMFYINLQSEDEPNAFREFLINPVFTAESEAEAALDSGEGCLSVSEDHPDQEGLVHRKERVRVKGYSYLQKKEVEFTKSGFEAIVLQHEMDHLNGKLFIDRINKKDKWTPHKNEELI